MNSRDGFFSRLQRLCKVDAINTNAMRLSNEWADAWRDSYMKKEQGASRPWACACDAMLVTTHQQGLCIPQIEVFWTSGSFLIKNVHLSILLKKRWSAKLLPFCMLNQLFINIGRSIGLIHLSVRSMSSVIRIWEIIEAGGTVSWIYSQLHALAWKTRTACWR